MEYAYLKVKDTAAPPGAAAAGGDKPVHLSSVPLTIGRHETNRLVINDSMASRFHCVIEQSKDGYLLRDLQSRNGTLLNGQRVMSTILKSNDVIAIGAVQMTIIVRHSSQGSEETFKPKTAPPRTPLKPSAAPAKGAKGSEPTEAVDDLEVLDELEVIDDPTAAVEGESIFSIIRRTAGAMLDKSFEADAIDLINTRGKLLREDRPANDKNPAAGGGATSETDLLLRLILLICFRSHATDIHLEPRAEDYLLRIRMDGNLLDIVALPREQGCASRRW